MRKRSFIAGAAFMLVAGAAAAADDFPTRPIRIVVASAAGGWLDVNARLVGQAMSEKLGQPVLVENRTGADGRIGTQYVKNAPADGYTMLAVAPSVVVTPALKTDPGYDVFNDFATIGPMARGVFLIVSGPDGPDKSFREFAARARANPDKISYASPGNGSLGYLASEALLKQAGLKVQAVPYKGAAPTVPDVIAGRVAFTAAAPGSVMTLVRSGKMRVLGVTSAQRLPMAPEIPTLAEQGLANFTFYQYHGLLVPAGVPDNVVQKLSEALRWALTRDPVKQRMKDDWAEPWASSPAEFMQFLRQDAARYVKLANDIGLKKE